MCSTGLAALVGMDADLARREAARLTAVAAWAVDEAAQPYAEELRLVGRADLAGRERLVRPGGPGSPEVPELAVGELAAALGLSPTAAHSLLADALSLVHRLPNVLAVVAEGTAPAWRARMVASATRDLRPAVVEEVDLRLSTPSRAGARPLLCRLSRRGLLDVIAQLTLTDDDAAAEGLEDGEAVAEAVLDSLDERRIVIEPGLFGVAQVWGTVSNADAERLDAALDAVAVAIADEEAEASGGIDERPHDLLRSVALGRLADLTTTVPAGLRTPAAVARARAATTLYLHHDHRSRTWLLDGHGPISLPEARELLGHSHVTLRPVLDLEAELTSTSYVAPPALREQLVLRQRGTCSFPFCTRAVSARVRRRHARQSGIVDVDHLRPWASGGRTSSHNLQLLCRFHHRTKTHTRWQVEQPRPGHYRWTSPSGHDYLVTAGTTTPLRR